MANEYVLPYTAEQIEQKLGESSSGGGTSGGGIIGDDLHIKGEIVVSDTNINDPDFIGEYTDITKNSLTIDSVTGGTAYIGQNDYEGEIHLSNKDAEDPFVITSTGVSCENPTTKDSWKRWLGISGNNSTPEIKPNFADNSWETIAWVAKNDDPSKYWKIGDYKLLEFPEVLVDHYVTYRSYGTHTNREYAEQDLPKLHSLSNSNLVVGSVEVVDSEKLWNKFNSLELSKLGDSSSCNSYEIKLRRNQNADKILFVVRTAESTYDSSLNTGSSKNVSNDIILADIFDTTGKKAEQLLLEEYGIDLKFNGAYDGTGNYVTNYDFIVLHKGDIKIEKRSYPVMIVDMNKDNISDPYDYGKSKAGLTMCVGITRGATDNAPPYDYVKALRPNVFDVCFFKNKAGEVLQLPYITDDGAKTYSPYRWCGSEYSTYYHTQSWEETKMREVLQHLFDSTDISDYVVPVEKMTATGLVKPEYNYVPRVYTQDKVFLPSEYELNGKRVYTNIYDELSATKQYAIVDEGETYEFFNRGYSRFFWNEEFLKLDTDRLYLWTRSKSKAATNADIDKANGACYLECRGNTFMLDYLNLKVNLFDFYTDNISVPVRLLKAENPLGVYEIYYESYDETNDMEHISIMKDGKKLFSGDSFQLQGYNIGVNLENWQYVSRDYKIGDLLGSFSVKTGTVAYEPRSGLHNLDPGNILPMFCL